MQITIEDLKSLLGQQPTTAPANRALPGVNIVVLDRGFVYVGNVFIEGEFLRIENAKNIRIWGTKKGLGELVTGPTDKTVLDDVGSLLAPIRAVIHILQCKSGW